MKINKNAYIERELWKEYCIKTGIDVKDRDAKRIHNAVFEAWASDLGFMEDE